MNSRSRGAPVQRARTSLIPRARALRSWLGCPAAAHSYLPRIPLMSSLQKQAVGPGHIKPTWTFDRIDSLNGHLVYSGRHTRMYHRQDTEWAPFASVNHPCFRSAFSLFSSSCTVTVPYSTTLLLLPLITLVFKLRLFSCRCRANCQSVTITYASHGVVETSTTSAQ
jgi:hypothetical protein